MFYVGLMVTEKCNPRVDAQKIKKGEESMPTQKINYFNRQAETERK